RGWRSFFRQSYPSENVAVAGSVGRVHQRRFALDPRDRVVGLELARSRDRFLRLLQMAQHRGRERQRAPATHEVRVLAHRPVYPIEARRVVPGHEMCESAAAGEDREERITRAETYRCFEVADSLGSL